MVAYTFNTDLIFEIENIDEKTKIINSNFITYVITLSILKLPFVKILRAYGGYLGVQYDEGRE